MTFPRRFESPPPSVAYRGDSVRHVTDTSKRLVTPRRFVPSAVVPAPAVLGSNFYDILAPSGALTLTVNANRTGALLEISLNEPELNDPFFVDKGDTIVTPIERVRVFWDPTSNVNEVIELLFGFDPAAFTIHKRSA